MFDEAKNKHIKTEISYSPLSPYKISSIYFPLEKILITSKATDINVTKKIINMDRFISKDFSHVEKQTIKENKKTATTIINRAIGELKLTKKLHDNIEQIYINAMDFKSKEDFTKQCIAKLLGAE